MQDMRLARSSADGYRVVAVVLLSPHKGLHILRTDQLDLMPERFELASPIECAGASFEDDRARINLGDRFRKLVAHHSALQHDATVPVDAMKLEHILGDVHAEGLNRHLGSPSNCGLSI